MSEVYIKLLCDNGLKLIPEDEETNIEYKWRLDKKTQTGLNKMIAQMLWRLEKGYELNGIKHAHYVLGVHDNGEFGLLSKDDINITFNIFAQLIEQCSASISDKYEFNDKTTNSNLIFLTITKIYYDTKPEINIAFVGETMSGKTTTISNLVYGQLDDGNGFARKLIFKHEHEQLSGETSYITNNIIGIKNGELINYSIGLDIESTNITEMSDKILNLIDLPGKTNYLKTTFHALATYKIDCLIITVNELDNLSTNPNIQIYIQYANYRKIPYVILHPKIDIKKINDVNTKNIFFVSNTTGVGIVNFVHYLDNIQISHHIESPIIISPYDNLLPHVSKINQIQSMNIFLVLRMYSSQDIKTIFSGIMKCGSLSIGQQVFLTNGKNNIKTTIKSICKKHMSVHTLNNDEYGTIQFELDTEPYPFINKHMLITTKKYPVYNKFLFNILYNNENIPCIKQNEILTLIISNIIVSVNVTNIHSYNKVYIEIKGDGILLPYMGKSGMDSFLKRDKDSYFFGFILLDM
jgi:GTPase